MQEDQSEASPFCSELGKLGLPPEKDPLFTQEGKRVENSAVQVYSEIILTDQSSALVPLIDVFGQLKSFPKVIFHNFYKHRPTMRI